MSHGLSKRIKYALRKEFEGYHARLRKLEASADATLAPVPVPVAPRSSVMFEAMKSVAYLTAGMFAVVGLAAVGGLVSWRAGLISTDQVLATLTQVNGWLDPLLTAGGVANAIQWLRVFVPIHQAAKQANLEETIKRVVG